MRSASNVLKSHSPTWLPILVFVSVLLGLIGLAAFRSTDAARCASPRSNKAVDSPDQVTAARTQSNVRRIELSFPSEIKRLHINIGPHRSPINIPEGEGNEDIGVLLVEANLGVANDLRERRQKRFPNRFFVIHCAVAGPPLAGGFHTFRAYNSAGMSSSLAKVKANSAGQVPSWSRRPPEEIKFGPGAGGVDFVPVLSLDVLLDAIPRRIEIPFLKTDTQGFDFQVIKSAGKERLRRIEKLMNEVYVNVTSYEGVQNDLRKDWIPFMTKMGYKLMEYPKRQGEFDAHWTRIN